MPPLFTAIEPFGPANGDAWTKYVEWAQLPQLRRLVSLDGLLCPSVLKDRLDEDWGYLADVNVTAFHSLNYLLSRVPTNVPHRVLCVFKNPEMTPELPPEARDFEFAGYDLIDADGSVSALTNCGGWPDVFANHELSPDGLLVDLDRAKRAQEDLWALHPEEAHADCDLWAIYCAPI